MFRRSILPCAGFALALGVLAFAPAPLSAQDRSTQERLDRLERDLNMLQRQVYRGAPGPLMADPGGAVGTELRMNRLEEQMRDLTGRVEEYTNQIERLRQRIEQINSDVDLRFNGSPQVAGAPPVNPPPPVRLAPSGSARASGIDSLGGGTLTPPGASPSATVGGPGGPLVQPPQPGGPTPIFGFLSPPGATPSNPPDASSDPASTSAPGFQGGGVATSEQYNHAFGLLRQTDYPAAESAFRAFVDQHPNDPMAGIAQYWLGETYYARARYLEAAAAFAEGYKRYPKNAKAAEELLKLGMALGRTNQKQNGCVALAQLDHDFPNSGAAIKERALAERKHLGC